MPSTRIVELVMPDSEKLLMPGAEERLATAAGFVATRTWPPCLTQTDELAFTETPPRIALLAGTAEPVELTVPLIWTLAPVPRSMAPAKPRPLTVMVLPATVVTW